MSNDTKMYSRICKSIIDGEAWRMRGMTFGSLCVVFGADQAKINEKLVANIGYTGDGLIRLLKKQELWGLLFGSRLETLQKFTAKSL